MELLRVVLIGATVGVMVGPLVGGSARRAGAVVGALLGIGGATLGAFFGRATGSRSAVWTALDMLCAMLGASLVVLGYAVFRSRRFTE